jgi:DNA polymerase/3'-5' exonuclease PolX
MEYIHGVSHFAEVAGSVRRLKPSVSDIDIVIQPHNTAAIWNRIDVMLDNGTVRKAIYGDGKTRWGETYRGCLFMGMKVEIHLCTPENRGYIYWLYTGDGDKNQYVMRKLIEHQSLIRFHDGSAWHVSYDKNHPKFNVGFGYAKLARLAVPDEQTFYTLIGMPFIAPHNRSEITYRRYLERAINVPPLEAIQLRYAEEAQKQGRLF